MSRSHGRHCKYFSIQQFDALVLCQDAGLGHGVELIHGEPAPGQRGGFCGQGGGRHVVTLFKQEVAHGQHDVGEGDGADLPVGGDDAAALVYAVHGVGEGFHLAGGYAGDPEFGDAGGGVTG